jgi:hypothetical protein
MKRLGEKYIAGFLDADGSFSVQMISCKAGFYPRLTMQFSQETNKDKILFMIQDSVGGTVSYQTNHAILNVPQKKAKGLLCRIRKYLVLKRGFAEAVIDFLDNAKPPYTKPEAEFILAYMKQQRKIVETRLPNYPSRQWLAGYFDGDGCIGCSYRKESGRSYLSARIASQDIYAIGITLIQKAFGGDIYQQEQKGWSNPVWVLHLEPSKAKKFLEHFAKHSVVKRSQIYFALGCAYGGNYRNGKPIKEILSQLKSQRQRLNDSDVDVTPMLKSIRFDVEDNRGVHMRKRQSKCN